MRNKFQWDKEGEKSTIFLTAGNEGLSQKSSLKLSADTIFQKGSLTEEYFFNTFQK